jgi:hypothetical protein
LTTDSPSATRRLARGIGTAYLVNIVAGVFGLMYVPGQLSGHGDPAATVQHILAHGTLFRAGIAATLLCYVEFALLPLLFHRLLGRANRDAAALMVVLALLSVPLSIASLQYRLDILSWLGDAPWLHALDAGQRQAQVMLQLASYNHALLLAQVFWGLWLIPLGWLVIRSRQMPRLLGALLMLGGASYVVDVLGQLLVGGYDELPLAAYVTLPAALAEIGTCLWLLVRGARPAPHH